MLTTNRRKFIILTNNQGERKILAVKHISSIEETSAKKCSIKMCNGSTHVTDIPLDELMERAGVNLEGSEYI